MNNPQLFEWDVCESISRKEVIKMSEQPVPRPRGWVLFATRSGPQGYHRVRCRGELGSIVAKCGLVGHRIEEDQRAIILCPTCRDEE